MSALIMYVACLPAGRCAVVLGRPLPDVASQFAPLSATHVHVTLLRPFSGAVTPTFASVTSLGPAFATVAIQAWAPRGEPLALSVTVVCRLAGQVTLVARISWTLVEPSVAATKPILSVGGTLLGSAKLLVTVWIWPSGNVI